MCSITIRFSSIQPFFYTGGAQVLELKQEDFDSNFAPKVDTYTPIADAAELERQLQTNPYLY